MRFHDYFSIALGQIAVFTCAASRKQFPALSTVLSGAWAEPMCEKLSWFVKENVIVNEFFGIFWKKFKKSTIWRALLVTWPIYYEKK